ncbi:MAG: hypothetical protein LBU68_02915 [Rickettsiales bacterium]|jgi:glycogen debranching enzyme|nr:hypothetical protein [Rickettsiales bacterium]
MLEIATIALPNLLDFGLGTGLSFGLDVLGSNKKKKQAKKQKELLTQQTIAEYEEDKAELLLKNKIQKEVKINLLNKNIASSNATFAANGIKKSASANNFINARKKDTENEIANDDKILNLTLQNLYNAMQRSIVSQKFDYKNKVSDLNFGLINPGINFASSGMNVIKNIHDEYVKTKEGDLIT